jgi:hypothetical protein
VERPLADQVDEAGAQAESDPAVRAVLRLQAECQDPDVTIKLAAERMVIPADAPAEVTWGFWPDGTPAVVRSWWGPT